MAIFYRKVQNKSMGSKTYGKWYGKAVIMDNVSTKQLAEEISNSTTVTYADVTAVLAAMSTAMKGHLQNSQKVTLDGIGSFRAGLKTLPADTSGDFDSTKVVGYRLVYAPEKHFTPTGASEKGYRTGFYTTDLLHGVNAKEAPKNFVVDETDDEE